jgi:dihydroflavonol-4-reductase
MGNTLYLLTGAAGNLGSSVARQLSAEGKKVRALVLKDDPSAARLPKDVEILVGDVTDVASLDHFFDVDEGTDVIVIHCASIVTVTPDYSKKVYEVNVTGTKNIVEKCVEYGVKKLVYISSTGAIPELPKGNAIVEVTDFPTEKIVGFYGKTKAEATQAVVNAVRCANLDASIVFPTGISGPGDYAYGPVASFIIEYVRGEMPVGIDGCFNAVDVRDLASGVIACCEKGRKGEGYIMGNACVSMKKMIHLISKESGAKEIRVILPIWIAAVIARLASFFAKYSGKRPKMTSYAVYNLSRNNNFSFDKAAKELGYKVRPFEETIADTIAWLKIENKI